MSMTTDIGYLHKIFVFLPKKNNNNKYKAQLTQCKT